MPVWLVATLSGWALLVFVGRMLSWKARGWIFLANVFGAYFFFVTDPSLFRFILGFAMFFLPFAAWRGLLEQDAREVESEERKWEQAERDKRRPYDSVAADILDALRVSPRPTLPRGPWGRRRSGHQPHPTHSHSSSCNGKEALGEMTAAESRQQLPAYCLYLRPFRFTGSLSVQHTDPTYRMHFGNYGGQSRHIDIETLFLEQFAGKLEFVALGRPTEKPPSSGSARRVYLDDAEWWLDVVRLAEGATLIVVMPDPSDHCVREASWLRAEQLFSICIFYMRGSVYRGENWYEVEWNKAVERFREVGITLPRYDPAGAIFTLDLAGTVRKLAILDFPKAFFKSKRLRDRLMQLGEP